MTTGGEHSDQNNLSLVLRCREIGDISRHVSELMTHPLEVVADAAQIYTFKHRLKPPTSIFEKVQRKRTEGCSMRSKHAAVLAATDVESEPEREKLTKRITNLEGYGPDHVTDAWGCRFITLFQDQIPLIVRSLLARLEAFNQESAAKVTLKEFVIYTNRLNDDPLSITLATLAIARESGLAGSVVSDRQAIRSPESRKSAYSSVHMIFGAPLIIDHPGRESVNEVGQFEIQIRDIFEEGWGEIEHFLVYSDKENPASSGDDDGRPWHLSLNSLKDHVNGCSSSASLISRAAQADNRKKMPTLDTKSATHRDVDRSAIIAALQSKVPADSLQKIDAAYSSLIAAESAQTKEEMSANYAIAAGLFEQAIVEVNEHAYIKIESRGNRPVEYFLRMELANCYLYGAMDLKLDEAIEVYERFEGAFPADPIPRIRKARASIERNPTPQIFRSANKTLTAALELISADALTGPNHWLRMSVFVQLGFNHWKLSVALAKEGKGNDQLRELKEAARVTLLAYDFWKNLPSEHASGETHRLLAHKAVSNVLYYAAHIREIAPVEEYAAVEQIRKWIGQASAIQVPWYRDHFRMQDSLMQAHAAIGDSDEAQKISSQIYDHLKKVAERRAGRLLKFADIPNHLYEDELPAFWAAVGIKLGNA